MSFEIVYAGPGPNGTPIKDQGWRVYRMTYAKSHMGNPIKRKNQVPYRKLVAVCETEEEAIRLTTASTLTAAPGRSGVTGNDLAQPQVNPDR